MLMRGGGRGVRLRKAEAGGALARIATALAVTSIGALSIGAAAVGVVAIGKLAIKTGRIHRLEIDELLVGGRPFRAGA